MFFAAIWHMFKLSGHESMAWNQYFCCTPYGFDSHLLFVHLQMYAVDRPHEKQSLFSEQLFC